MLLFQAEEMIVTPGEGADDSLDHFPSSRPLKMIKTEHPSAPETPDVTLEGDAASAKFPLPQMEEEPSE